MHIGFVFKKVEVSSITKYCKYEDLKTIFYVHLRVYHKELVYIFLLQAFEPTIALSNNLRYIVQIFNKFS